MSKPPTEFGGEEHFRAAPERLFALLTDLDAMAALIPDRESAERASDRSMRCVVRPGFSFLRGKMKLLITLEELQPPESATTSIAAQGIGVSMKVVSQMQIAPEGEGSKLTWKARIEELRGLAAALSPGLINAAADQIMRNAWTEVRRQLGE